MRTKTIYAALSLMLLSPIVISAQYAKGVRMNFETDKIEISYSPGRPDSVRLIMTQDGRDWKELHKFTNHPDGMVEWDIFAECPDGVQNARFRVLGYSDADIYPETLREPGPNSVVQGHFAYFLHQKSETHDDGILKTSRYTSAMNRVTVTAYVSIYDFVEKAWIMNDHKVGSEYVRVPRNLPSKYKHYFTTPEIPEFSIKICYDGTVRIGYHQVSDDAKDALCITDSITIRPRFSRFAKDYVERKIDEWQVKGEFEKTVDYRNRILGERDSKIAQYTEEAKRLFIEGQRHKNLRTDMTLKRYDSDNEVFLVSSRTYGDLLVPVPVSEAPKFKKGWDKVAVIPEYAIENDQAQLVGVAFRPNKGRSKQAYYYRKDNKTEYSIPEIAFNFKPIEIDGPVSTTTTASNAIVKREKVVVGNQSDVDTDIPEGSRTANSNTFAVIISNENYRRVAPVEYAINDGRSVASYMRRTLGLSEDHVHHVEDATLNDIRNEIDWIKSVGKAYGGEASFIVYYAGHGLPDETNRNGFLLPIDGYGSNVSTALSMNDLAEELGSIDSKVTLVLLDACFSGAVRSGGMLSSERGVALKVKPHSVKRGNVIMVSASQEDQTASKYEEQGHGLFTYYLLKNLQQSKGRITIGNLVDDVITNVNRVSVVTNNKSQTPVVVASPAISAEWRTIRIDELSKQ